MEMTGVKPWLLPNCRSAGCATHYIDGSGMVEGGIGTTIRLDRINTAGAPAIPSPGPLPALVDFYALNFISTARACPAGISPSCNLGVNDYEDDVPAPTVRRSVAGQRQPAVSGQDCRGLRHAGRNQMPDPCIR